MFSVVGRAAAAVQPSLRRSCAAAAGSVALQAHFDQAAAAALEARLVAMQLETDDKRRFASKDGGAVTAKKEDAASWRKEGAVAAEKE